MKDEQEKKQQDRWQPITGTTAESKNAQEPQPDADETGRVQVGSAPADGQTPKTTALSKYTFHTQPSEPTGAAPVLIPRTTLEIIQKNKTRGTNEAMQKELVELSNSGVGIFYDAETGVWGNSLNEYPARVLVGIITEFSRQSKEIQTFLEFTKKPKGRKKQINIQPDVKITTPGKSGFPALGYPKDTLTGDELGLLQKLKVKPNEPVCFIYPQQFAKDYFGIDIQGAQRARFVGYINQVCTQRFAWEHDGETFTRQLCEMVTKTSASGRTCVLIKWLANEFYSDFANSYLKLNQNTHVIQQHATGLFEMRLYLHIVDEWKKRHNYGGKSRKNIWKTYSQKELFELCATPEELAQRKTKQLQKRLYDFLQVLIEQGVLISYTHDEFNTDGKIGLEIARYPFVIRQKRQNGDETTQTVAD